MKVQWWIGIVLGILLGIPSEGLAAQWQLLDVPETGTYARWYLPDSASPTPDSGHPVIVFLHGSGSSPEAWFPQLQPEAELSGAVLLVPRSISSFGWGVGRDQETLEVALDRLEQAIPINRHRIGLAGHSSGGAFSYVVGLAGKLRPAGIFALAAPFRTVLQVSDPTYTPPVRLYYGEDDPNHAILEPLEDQLDRLGVDWEVATAAGHGHGSWPVGTLTEGFAFLLARSYPGPCVSTRERLCLRQGRFAVEVTYRDHQDETGPGRVVPGAADDSGLFWFFEAANWELMVKVIDGCGYNGHFWVFGAASTDVEYHLRVTDLQSGGEAFYDNELGVRSPAINDTAAFATCP